MKLLVPIPALPAPPCGMCPQHFTPNPNPPLKLAQTLNPIAHLQPVLHLPGTFSPLKSPRTPHPASHGQASFLPSGHHHLETSAQRTHSLRGSSLAGTGILD